MRAFSALFAEAGVKPLVACEHERVYASLAMAELDLDVVARIRAYANESHLESMFESQHELAELLPEHSATFLGLALGSDPELRQASLSVLYAACEIDAHASVLSQARHLVESESAECVVRVDALTLLNITDPEEARTSALQLLLRGDAPSSLEADASVLLALGPPLDVDALRRLFTIATSGSPLWGTLPALVHSHVFVQDGSDESPRKVLDDRGEAAADWAAVEYLQSAKGRRLVLDGSSTHSRVRLESMRLLPFAFVGVSPGPEVEAVLLNGLDDEDEAVALAALDVLDRMPVQSPAVLGAVRRVAGLENAPSLWGNVARWAKRITGRTPSRARAAQRLLRQLHRP